MPLEMKQYGTTRPIPDCVQQVLVELNKLMALNPQVVEDRFHCSYLMESQDWCFGSNFEEGWDTLVYREAEKKWKWREPWEGTDTDADESESPASLAMDLLSQVMDPLSIKTI